MWPACDMRGPVTQTGGAGRAGQGRAGQGRAGQGRAGQGRAGQGRAGQGRMLCMRSLVLFRTLASVDCRVLQLLGSNAWLGPAVSYCKCALSKQPQSDGFCLLQT
jgi:hypothetical protein